MNFQGRAVRSAVVCWALYLVIALSAFTLHSHSSHHVSHLKSSAPCALCLAHNVVGAMTVVAAPTLLASAVLWHEVLWPGAPDAPLIAPAARRDEARGPPAKVFFFTS